MLDSKIYVKPLNNINAALTGKYVDSTGVTRVLLKDGRHGDIASFKEADLKNNLFILNLAGKTAIWDIEKNKQERGYFEFFKDFPHTFIKGEDGKNANANATHNVCIELYDKSQDEKNEWTAFERETYARNILQNVLQENLYSLCSALGINDDLHREDTVGLRLKLIAYMSQDPQRFIDDMKHTNRENLVRKGVIKNAIDKEIITKKGSIYLYGDYFLGHNEDEIFVELVAKEDMYILIRKKVAMNEPVTAERYGEIKTKGDEVKEEAKMVVDSGEWELPDNWSEFSNIEKTNWKRKNQDKKRKAEEA